MQLIPNQRSLLWRLLVVLAVTSILTVAISGWLTRTLADRAVLLSEDAKTVMREHARQAERAWQQGGEAGLQRWLAALRAQHDGGVVVVDAQGQSLIGNALTAEQLAGLRFQRELHWRMSSRLRAPPYIGIPFPEQPDAGRLVMQLPAELVPGRHWPMLRLLLLILMPALSAFLLGCWLYRRIMLPLGQLQAQVQAFQGNHDARVGTELLRRGDEFAQLGQCFNQMAERVSGLLGSQRQLLFDMSHELRTPLSRLAVALDSPAISATLLRQRLGRELLLMSELVDGTLALAWGDAEQQQAATAPLRVADLWAVLVEDACFESGWHEQQFVCSLPGEVWVLASLNELARAMENILRNSLRYSPEEGTISLAAVRRGDHWQLSIEDQGGGVDESQLQRMFSPFVRLDTARTADKGLGLGLSIAERAMTRQHGKIWATNGSQGLRVCWLLPAYDAAE